MNFVIVMKVAQPVHRFHQNRGDDRLVADATRACLGLHVRHDVCACTGINNLHDDPKKVGVDEGHVL